MLLGVAGLGDSSPSPFHTYHILGSSRHTVLHTSIISLVCSFCNYFCLFSLFFSRFFTIFRIFGPWPHAAHGTRSRNTETGAGRPRGAATPTQGGLWPPPHRAGPPARSAAAESAGGSRADRGHASPAQSDRRAASPAGAGRGGARPPWRVPPRARGGTDYPEPPERARGGAGGGA